MTSGVWVIKSDGGARGNPGPAACGFVAEEDGREVVRQSKYLGETTNNIAEYEGVILGLKWLSEEQGINDGTLSITFYLDSELVVKQLNGKYKIKNQKLLEKAMAIKKIMATKSMTIKFIHIPRHLNKIADLLVNQELDKQSQKNSG